MWDCFAVVANKLSGTQSRLFQSLFALKEFAAHLIGLHASTTEPSFGFCVLRPHILSRQHPEGRGQSNRRHHRRSVQLQRGEPQQRHRPDRIVAAAVLRLDRSTGMFADFRPVSKTVVGSSAAVLRNE